MKNSKLLEEAKRNPGRIYQRPSDVLRDRRLDDGARTEVLTAWREMLKSDPDGSARLQRDELETALQELQRREEQSQAAK